METNVVEGEFAFGKGMRILHLPCLVSHEDLPQIKKGMLGRHLESDLRGFPRG
jgi:hypothetical protein